MNVCAKAMFVDGTRVSWSATRPVDHWVLGSLAPGGGRGGGGHTGANLDAALQLVVSLAKPRRRVKQKPRVHGAYSGPWVCWSDRQPNLAPESIPIYSVMVAAYSAYLFHRVLHTCPRAAFGFIVVACRLGLQKLQRGSTGRNGRRCALLCSPLRRRNTPPQGLAVASVLHPLAQHAKKQSPVAAEWYRCFFSMKLISAPLAALTCWHVESGTIWQRLKLSASHFPPSSNPLGSRPPCTSPATGTLMSQHVTVCARVRLPNTVCWQPGGRLVDGGA